MIDRNHRLSVTRQAELVGISRGSGYYLPRPASEADLKLMRRLDELHLDHPFMGARMLRDQLHREGMQVGRRLTHRVVRSSQATPAAVDISAPLATRMEST